MPETAGFDLYDERWRACWLAATAAARLRKKQVDLDISKRVQKLIEEFGPRSERPLTLRIYGTMIKGFCVLSNERARSLTADCERLVLMCTRQPFAEADSAMRLPAAKKPRMEAALTLDVDLARVEASEAFDWTQAPLEEGALLRLGGGGELLSEDALLLPPAQASLGLGGMLGELGGGMAAFGAGETGWLPRLEPHPEGAAAFPSAEVLAGQAAAVDLTGAAESQLVLASDPPAQAPPAHVAPESFAPAAVPTRQLKRRFEMLIRPGAVYGFDGEPSMRAEQYEAWQGSDLDLSFPRVRPTAYADQMDEVPEQAEHFCPWLRQLVDTHSLRRSAALDDDGVAPPQAQDHDVLQGQGISMQDQELQQPWQQPPPWNCADAVGQAPAGDTALPWADSGLAEVAAPAGGAEAQDDRTAEVGNILRACLSSGESKSTKFHELVPPGQAERTTAACTFAAVLALASAGDFIVSQGEAYGPIVISMAA